MGKMADRLKQKRLAKKQSAAPAAHSAEAQLTEQAVAAHKTQNFDKALKLYHQVLDVNPHNAMAHNNLGVLYLHKNLLDYAERHFTHAYPQKKNFPLIDRGLGFVYYGMKKYADAAVYLERFIQKNKDPQAEGALLESYNKSFQFKKVLSFLANKPREAWSEDAYDAYLDAKIALKERDEGLDVVKEAADKNPDNIALQNMLAKAYASVKKFDKAFEVYHALYEQYPDSHQVKLNYALALTEVNRLTDAEKLYDDVLHDNPASFEAYMNKAHLMRKKRDLNAAIECVRSAMEIDPASPLANYTYGIINVQNENYPEGYAYHEWSWHVADMEKFRPQGNVVDWQGEDVNGKTLLLYTDQGIGDTILHVRYVDRILKEWPQCHIVFVCEDKTVELYETTFNGQNVKVYGKTHPMDGVTAHAKAALCSLPYLFGDDIRSIPDKVPYLKASKDLSYKNDDKDIIIGITWHTKSVDAGHKRSVALEQFAPIAACPHVRLLNLQYGDTEEARKNCGFEVIHDPDIDPWHDMQGHINQIAACDIVITVDNTTAHAAGAMGKPTWTLLPHEPYWRCWHLDKSSTPWYPTIRVFQQDAGKDFRPLIDRMTVDLKKLAEGDKLVLQAEPFKPTWTPDNQPQALVVNDTYNWYHWGCTATSGAIRDQLADKGYAVTSLPHQEGLTLPVPELEHFDDPVFLDQARFVNPTLFWKISQADIVVVNGEGSIHGIKNARRWLYLIYKAATHFKKPVYVINHACFPEDNDALTDPKAVAYYLKAYKAATGVAVRDPISHSLLTSLGIDVKQAFDSLPLAAKEWLQTQPDKPKRKKRVVLAGSSKFSAGCADAFKKNLQDLIDQGYELTVLIGARRTMAAEDAPFCRFIESVIGKDNFTIVFANSLGEWFDHIRTATLLISGRFHYSIAAACMGTPFIAFEGLTPKLQALTEFLNQPAPLFYDSVDLTADLGKRIAMVLRGENTGFPDGVLDQMCALAAENYAFIPKATHS